MVVVLDASKAAAAVALSLHSPLPQMINVAFQLGTAAAAPDVARTVPVSESVASASSVA